MKNRRKNIFKLAQGEFVAPEKLENVYVESALVRQVFVGCADLSLFPGQSGVLAVVVPDFDVLEKIAQLRASSGYSAADTHVFHKDRKYVMESCFI